MFMLTKKTRLDINVMIGVSNMSKPRTFKCKAYCKDFETCTRTSCNRSILFDYRNNTITMEEPSITAPVTTRMKKKIWSGDRTTFINDIH